MTILDRLCPKCGAILRVCKSDYVYDRICFYCPRCDYDENKMICVIQKGGD